MIRFFFNRFAVLGVALGLPAFAVAQATQTSISAETRDTAGRTQAKVSVSVDAEAGVPAGGAVVLQDGEKPLAGAILDAQGKAQIAVDLLPGAHELRAVYAGDGAHTASASEPTVLSAATGTTPDFTVTVNPGTLSLTAGQSGMMAVSVNPVNATGLTAPMFVTVACSGMPDQSSCTFTPTTVEVLPNTTEAVNSSLVVTTQGKGTRGAFQPASNNRTALAILLPGALGLAGLAFATRRRRWLSRLSFIALVGFVATLGTTAFAPRYDYYNHGPDYNRPTPSGSYNITVTAQSSNGVTAITHTTSFALTVK